MSCMCSTCHVVLLSCWCVTWCVKLARSEESRNLVLILVSEFQIINANRLGNPGMQLLEEPLDVLSMSRAETISFIRVLLLIGLSLALISQLLNRSFHLYSSVRRMQCQPQHADDGHDEHETGKHVFLEEVIHPLYIAPH